MTSGNGFAIAGIPNEWETMRLHDIAEIRSGVAKNSNVEVSDPISVHYLRVANVQDGYLDLSEMSKIEISRNHLARFTVLPGDVLMNEGGDLDQLGRGALWKGQYSPCVHQNHVFVVRCRSTVTPEFLSHWTGSETAKSYFLVGGKQTTNLASINKTALGLLPVAVPPLDEQRAIAEALNDVDALLGVLDRMLTKKRDLKQAAMQQLLTGQTRLPEFNGEWEEKPLPSVCWYQEGPGVRNSQFTSSGVKLLNGTNIFRGTVNLESTTRFISKAEAYGPYSHFLADEGDIVLASSGITIDRLDEKVAFVAAANLPFCMNTSTIRFKPKASKLDAKYLYQFLMSDGFKKPIGLQATGSAQLNFGPSHVAKVNIALPNICEQTAIAEVLSDMDAEIAALVRRREKTQDLKQGMMQELLTGKTRLL